MSCHPYNAFIKVSHSPLLLQGTEDLCVSHEQSIAYDEALKAQGFTPKLRSMREGARVVQSRAGSNDLVMIEWRGSSWSSLGCSTLRKGGSIVPPQ